MKFKAHKIPRIDKSICNAEQKIAYNLLFAHFDIERSKAIDLIQKKLSREEQTTFKKFDIDLIYHYCLQSIDRHRSHNNTGILWNFEEIGAVIYSDYYKAA